MKKLIYLTALVVFLTSGCQTARGLGEDIENTGENIQEGSRDVQQ